MRRSNADLRCAACDVKWSCLVMPHEQSIDIYSKWIDECSKITVRAVLPHEISMDLRLDPNSTRPAEHLMKLIKDSLRTQLNKLEKDTPQGPHDIRDALKYYQYFCPRLNVDLRPEVETPGKKLAELELENDDEIQILAGVLVVLPDDIEYLFRVDPFSTQSATALKVLIDDIISTAPNARALLETGKWYCPRLDVDIKTRITDAEIKDLGFQDKDRIIVQSGSGAQSSYSSSSSRSRPSSSSRSQDPSLLDEEDFDVQSELKPPDARTKRRAQDLLKELNDSDEEDDDENNNDDEDDRYRELDDSDE